MNCWYGHMPDWDLEPWAMPHWCYEVGPHGTYVCDSSWEHWTEWPHRRPQINWMIWYCRSTQDYETIKHVQDTQSIKSSPKKSEGLEERHGFQGHHSLQLSPFFVPKLQGWSCRSLIWNLPMKGPSPTRPGEQTRFFSRDPPEKCQVVEHQHVEIDSKIAEANVAEFLKILKLLFQICLLVSSWRNQNWQQRMSLR